MLSRRIKRWLVTETVDFFGIRRRAGGGEVVVGTSSESSRFSELYFHFQTLKMLMVVVTIIGR